MDEHNQHYRGIVERFQREVRDLKHNGKVDEFTSRIVLHAVSSCSRLITMCETCDRENAVAKGENLMLAGRCRQLEKKLDQLYWEAHRAACHAAGLEAVLEATIRKGETSGAMISPDERRAIYDEAYLCRDVPF